MTTVRSLHTRVAAIVYRHDADPVRLSGELTRAPHTGGPTTVTGVTFQKRLGMQPGTFTIELREGSLDVYSEIRAGDWIAFNVSRRGIPFYGSLGLIVARQRSRTSMEGATSETWTLQCEDFTRIAARTQIWFDDYSGFETNVGGKILASRFNFNPGGPPDEVVLRIIDAWLGGDGIVGGPWLFPVGLRQLGQFFVDGLFAAVQSAEPLPLAEALARPPQLRGEMFDESALFQPEAGTQLDAFLTEWSNPLLNELWWDVSDEDDPRPTGQLEDLQPPRPTVFIREKPFVEVTSGSRSAWFSLPTVRLSRSSLFTDNLSDNDDERVTLFQLYATPGSMVNFEQYALFPPSYTREEAAKHGLRKYERVSKFASFGGRTDGTDWLEQLNQWHTLVSSWYGANHLWLSGTITVPFWLGEARVGKRLIIGDDSHEEREQFYIEGVGHQWRFPGKATTTLTVTRGFRGTDQELVDVVQEEQAKYQRGIEAVGFSPAEKLNLYVSPNQRDEEVT